VEGIIYFYTIADKFLVDQNILIPCTKVCFVRPGSIEIIDAQ